jgi:hypothetical protein
MHNVSRAAHLMAVKSLSSRLASPIARGPVERIPTSAALPSGSQWAEIELFSVAVLVKARLAYTQWNGKLIDRLELPTQKANLVYR